MSRIKAVDRWRWLGAVMGMVLAASPRAQETVAITELMAVNDGALRDEDGEASNWLELSNRGTEFVDLGGWHLTDSTNQLAKWTFPPTTLRPGEFLVVFASGKDRAVSGRPLHANFRLGSAGEYLALVRPDGRTVAHEYAPTYPPQYAGMSYGAEVRTVVVPLVSAGATAQWRVPSGPEDLTVDWQEGTDPAGWNVGQTGLGFDRGGTNTAAVGELTNLAFGKAAEQSSTLGSFDASGAVDGAYSGFTHTLAGGPSPATWEVDLATNASVEKIVLWNRADCCLSRLRDITVTILDATGTLPAYVSPLLNPENVLGGGVSGSGPANLTLDLVQLTGGPIPGARVRVSRAPDPDLSGSGGQGNSDEPEVLSLAEVEVWGRPVGPSIEPLIGTDLGAAMLGANPTVLARIPFTIPEDSMAPLDVLTLRMKYDDGFAAWLNGVLVAKRNAPEDLAWNSAATGEQDAESARTGEAIDLTPAKDLLVEGQNVLAIQGLNRAVNDPDFLLLPELEGAAIQVAPGRYFSTPTPGAANASGYLGVVADTKFSVNRGYYAAPISLAISTATAGAQIWYTTNGTAPDGPDKLLYETPLPISRTTVVRAQATQPGYLSSDIDTHTYLFSAEVGGQSASSALAAGFPAQWGSLAADYAMDPKVLAGQTTRLAESLGSLPSVFVTTSVSNLFDSRRGIYANPDSHGVAWERPASVEWLGTNGRSDFHVNCGLRIQGGYFRSAWVTHKHSFRLLFKSQYGPGKLRHDLFEEPGAATEFDGLVLRAGANDGYSWDGAGRTVQFLRDEFGRQLQLALGQPAPHGRFVHLYLNGLYWGLYNLTERPNEDFSAAYYGGAAEDWDAVNAGDVKNGDTLAWFTFVSQARKARTPAAYFQLQGLDLERRRVPNLPVYLDAANYIDYMILNMWGGNWDWPNKNFWFGRLRTAESTGFKFYVWDFENTMGNSRDRSPLDMVAPRPEIASSWVAEPHANLLQLAQYRLDFADRVQRCFFNAGHLTAGALRERYRRLAEGIEGAVFAESARWGDDTTSAARTVAEWVQERDWILDTYLPRRSDIVLDQFRAAGLYPSVGAPVFSHAGGSVPADFQLAITPPAQGAVYLTRDGSDPRDPATGAPAAGAERYTDPLPLTQPAKVRARVLDGSQWSALVETTFYPRQDTSALMLTELMYHALAWGGYSGDDLDFLELANAGDRPIHLDGFAFATGIGFNFPEGSRLAPGQYLVLAKNAAAFGARYPGVPVFGEFSGKLDDGGETITLVDASGAAALRVTYNDRAPWPTEADGEGFSLVRANRDPSASPDDPSQWRASVSLGGSPGAADPPPTWTPRFEAAELTSEGGLRLRFQVEASRAVRVEYRDSFSDGQWQLLEDVPAQPSARRTEVIDPSPASRPSRYYRLVSP